MCGIVGIYNLTQHHPIDQSLLERMLGLIRHRGPDEFGIYRDSRIGLGNARLSIIDLSTGSQPIANEDETVWIVFNGEIFNYVELRPELEAQGHRFTTTSDTEVIVPLYEQYGPRCIEFLNGQFAFAIWDRRPETGGGTLFMARDRVGIRPLFYTVADGVLIFGSEIKAILAHPAVSARLDLTSLAQVFTLWTTLSPRTVFEGIVEVPPGHTLTARDDQISVERYWELSFPEGGEGQGVLLSDEEYAEGLRELLMDATQIRLRADVPVGAYLSGGLDSSTITTLIRNYTSNYLKTFSIAFADPSFDEREHQERMVEFLGTDHRRVECAGADVGRVFPDVIWHAEWPILRTSPAPMFLLSQLVQQNDIKVVLTGEGADEFLGGYNIFKEAKLRHFWARDPDSAMRPLLLQRLYPYVQGLGSGGSFLEAFFRKGLTETDRLDYSHAIRWANTAPLRRFFSPEVQAALNGYDPAVEAVARFQHHPAFTRWTPLARAQYIEISIFMSEYLLSSQGDRMLMAHSVEGRFPFLDHRVIEFAGHIPPRLKIRGLNEKYILKQAMRGLLPESVYARAKRPYRAPIHRSFFGPGAPAYVDELLSPEAIRAAGYFHPPAVARLVKKAQSTHPLSERDNMALAGVLSTQLLHRQFVENFSGRPIPPITLHRLCLGPD
ncbi:MAG: asparagine synthase (glutamine-hydrolyzing) [Chloroflexota bacterium]|nr:MAG: asparagine synthase (glutamine-hydrolyzing) [Chloroflexota bacterium]